MDYRIDDNYLDSQQFTNDMNEDVDVIMNLKHKMGKKWIMSDAPITKTEMNKAISHPAAQSALKEPKVWVN